MCFRILAISRQILERATAVPMVEKMVAGSMTERKEEGGRRKEEGGRREKQRSYVCMFRDCMHY